MKAGLLLSGGMDSLALAWWKRPAWAVTIDYGQKPAEAEIEVASIVCKELGITHEVIRVDCRSLGSGDLADTPANALASASDWWPYRNQLLLTLAAMRAVTRNVNTLMLGAVKGDGDHHRDGTEEFVRLMDHLASYQEGHLRIVAPALAMTTAELIRLAKVPPNLLAWAHSCHRGNTACGQCRGCNKYTQTYRELGTGYAGPP